MSSLLKGAKRIPLMTIHRKGIKPQDPHHLLQAASSKVLTIKNESFSNSAQESKSDDLAEEPELGVDKLFPCDILQAHWISEMIACCPKWVISAQCMAQQARFDCPLEYAKPFLRFLRNHTHSYFQQMDIISCVDHIGEPMRFEISYGLRNVMYWNNIRVHTRVDELTHVPSVTELYGSAECLENKIYDMYGVFFKDHPDLRRVLTDYGFQGHPMRRDFPVTGYTEMRYDDSLRRIVYEPVEMAQELRKYDFLNPWYLDDIRKERP